MQVLKKSGASRKGGLAVIGGSVAGVATAFGVMTKNALDSYASLEQNIGGIETLFKDSSQKVIDSAKLPIRRARYIANAYMETVRPVAQHRSCSHWKMILKKLQIL